MKSGRTIVLKMAFSVLLSVMIVFMGFSAETMNQLTVYAAEQDAYLRDRQIYLEYLSAEDWMSPDGDTYFEEVMDDFDDKNIGINATAMFDFNEDGVYELYFTALSQNSYLPRGLSSLLTIENGKPKPLLHGVQTGGGWFGEYITFYYDNQTKRDVITLEQYGYGGGAFDYEHKIYDYRGTELELLAVFGESGQNWSGALVPEDIKYSYPLDDGEGYIYYYTKDSADVTANSVNVTEAAYQDLFERFGLTQEVNRYPLADVTSQNLLPVPDKYEKASDIATTAMDIATAATDITTAATEQNTKMTITPSLFVDIDGHWAEKDIQTLTLNGFINGMTEAAFEPESYVTREQLVKLIVTTLDIYRGYTDFENVTIALSDVKKSDWSFPYIWDAVDFGILDGSGEFLPQVDANRETCALWIAKGLELNITSRDTRFSDHSSFQYPGAVAAVVDAGIILGFDDNTFRPNEQLTRAQAAAMLNRAFQYMLKHQTDMLEFDVMDRIRADFNGDGKTEEALLYGSPAESSPSGGCYYFIELNGIRSRTVEVLSFQSFKNVDIKVDDAYTELTISYLGPWLNRCAEFYRYTGDDFYHMGTLPSYMASEAEEGAGTVDANPTGFIDIEKDGTLFCTRPAVFVQSWVLDTEYFVNDKGRLEIREKDVYYAADNSLTVTLLKNISAAGDATHPGISLSAGDTIRLLATDLKEWIFVSDSSDRVGWIRVIGDPMEFAGAYFEGRMFYD